MQFTKLPTDLSERLISKVCRKNFTISELILTMINNDNFRVQLFNLVTFAVDTSNKDFLTFNENGTSLDILKLCDDKMIKKFEKLIIDGWISIKFFISSKLSLFEFLCKYSERCYFMGEDIHSSTEIIEYFFDPKKSTVGVINPLKPLDGCVMSKNIKIKMNMKVEKAVECLEAMLEKEKSLKQYKFDFGLLYTLEINEKECVDEMISKFEMFDDFLKTHRIKVHDFKIDLTVVLDEGVSNQIAFFLKISSNDYYVKKIKSITFMRGSLTGCHILLISIKYFKYLETICIYKVTYVDYVSLGSLKSMKYLKQLIFLYSNVSHSWMNESLPDCIERLHIFQSEDYHYTQPVLKIPSSLKILEIKIAENLKEYEFGKFDFTNAFSLRRIHLIDNVSPLDEIIIKGLKEVPENLKYLTDSNDNFRFNFIFKKSRVIKKISGIDMKGIYSNINRANDDDNSWLVRN